MTEKNQTQRAGRGSQQYQVIINQGITEERARVIVDEKLQSAIQCYTKEAHRTAEQRIKQFSDDLIPKLVKENLLDELTDPSIQILLVESQRAAAASERQADYSLLSELLVARIQKGENRSVRASISRAIEIVDKISDDALLGLTVAFAIERYGPASGMIFQGLDMLDQLFEKLCYDTFPLDDEWIEHLDILDAVRMDHFMFENDFKDGYCKKLSGYVAVGIKKDSVNYSTALAILQKYALLPEGLLIDHELNEGYVRIAVTDEDKIDSIRYKLFNHTGQAWMDLKKEQKQGLHQIYALYENNEDLSQDIKMKFYDEIMKRHFLCAVQNWWNKVSISFTITSVGRILAHANAKRLEDLLPDIRL